MWRLWTKGWGVRDWWWWVKDVTPQKIAWLLPRKVALWAFIRVYANGVDSPGPEYSQCYHAWENRTRNA